MSRPTDALRLVTRSLTGTLTLVGRIFNTRIPNHETLVRQDRPRWKSHFETSSKEVSSTWPIVIVRKRMHTPTENVDFWPVWQ